MLLVRKAPAKPLPGMVMMDGLVYNLYILTIAITLTILNIDLSIFLYYNLLISILLLFFILRTCVLIDTN